MAAIVVEPVQGEGGFVVAPQEFMEGIRRICDDNGIVMVVDEVQTGFGRTGRLFAIEHYGVEPDLITVAKSIAAGLPLSAVLGRAEIMDAPGAERGRRHRTSAIPSPRRPRLPCSTSSTRRASSSAPPWSARRSEHACWSWQERYEEIGDVRGLGAMLAIELVHDRESKNPAPELVAAVCDEAFRNGLLLLSRRDLLQRRPRPRPADDRGCGAGGGARGLGAGARARPRLGRRSGHRRVGAPPQGKSLRMVGEVVADRYELEELVGTGGMSSVYRARDRLLERQVAIKVLHEHYSRDDDYVERFRREARAAAKLSHPNIVTVIDRGEADGRQFIVFEYVDGENLKQLVAEQGAAAGTRRARARDPDRARRSPSPTPRGSSIATSSRRTS